VCEVRWTILNEDVLPELYMKVDCTAVI